MQITPPKLPLTDGVVTLRPPSERDLSAIKRAVHDPDVVRAFGRATSSAADLLELNRRRWRNGSGATFAICGADSDCVGHVFVNISDQGRGSVGYWLLPEARGRGFATRSVRLISNWAFEELGIARLQLLTDVTNVDSQGVAERAGFTREGVLRSFVQIGGRRLDYVMYSLLPTDRG